MNPARSGFFAKCAVDFGALCHIVKAGSVLVVSVAGSFAVAA
jgi:hypothetical protein